MNIDLGYLGKVVLEEIDHFEPDYEGFIVVSDGYTASGVRVHGVIDDTKSSIYPTVWRNAILIKVD